MKTKSCIVPSILLMLSLEAALLVAGRPSAAAVADDADTIRLPSDGQDRAATRPWKCCDRTFCTKSIPPICTCVDEVDQCASTCKACAPSMLNPSRHVCEDRYIGDPGPECTEDGDLKAKGASHDHQVGVAAANKNGEEEKRPWKCCDLALCTMSYPPTCRCVDQVEQCAATCKSCEPTTSDSSRHVCNDRYHGFPGPKCTEDGDLNDDVPKAKGASHDHQVSVAAAEKNGEEEKRPWKCCDLALCTRSYPLTCRCVDQVEQCAATCKSCKPSTSDSSLHVCNDLYHGFPGPKCTEAVAAGGN